MNSEIPTINNQELLNIGLLQKLSILSIDVVIGSVLCGGFVVKLLGVEPGFAWWIVLPISVWIIYTTDHLIDGYKLKEKAHTYRHYFHFRYIKQLILTILIFSAINIILVLFFLENQIVVFGIVAASITGLYLLGVHLFIRRKSWFFQKELFVATVYTIGIWGGPASLIDFNLQFYHWVCLFVFCILVLTDLFVFSLYEIESDHMDEHNTLVLNMGKKGTERLILFNLTLVFIFSILLVIFGQGHIVRSAAKIFLIMALMLVGLIVFQGKLRNHSLYRYIGELIFWLPGLALLV